MSPVAKSFLEYIKNNKEDIKQNHFNWINNY